VQFYPEGTLTRDPDVWPMTGKSGAARVALMTGAPVIPVAHWGAHEIMPPYGMGGKGKVNLFPRHKVVVSAGPPVDLSKYQGQEITAQVLRDATEDIMTAITEVLAGIRGEQPPAERYDMRKAAKERAEAAAAKGGRAKGAQGEAENDEETEK
jgi:1-acyl-sn-glycerol-3-phosphate acyltransferase